MFGGFGKSCNYSGGVRQELYMVLEMNGPQLQSANMLEEVEFYRALFELYEGGVVCPNTQFNGFASLTLRSSCIKD